MENLPEDSEDTGNSLTTIADAIGIFFGKAPAALKRNIAKVVGHLFKVPNAYLDGLAEELKATSGARAKIITATGDKLAQAVEVDYTLAQLATHVHASKILRQQTNATKVLKFAAEEISQLPNDQLVSEEGTNSEISEDWLNAFESEAINMSSEQMQKLFGKMLAGEIINPSSFSIRTIKIMGQMDSDVATIFRRFCSISFTHKVGPQLQVVNGGPITLGKPYNTALNSFDLGYFDILNLEEYGLISSSTPTKALLSYSVYDTDNNSTNVPISYCNEDFILVPKGQKGFSSFDDYSTPWFELSRVGRELFNVVELEENLDFTKTMTDFFDSEGLLLSKSPSSLQAKFRE